MGKKATKSMKKFASSGQLKKTIDARRKHQQIKKRAQGKKTGKEGKAKPNPKIHDGAMDDEEDVVSKKPAKGSVRSLFHELVVLRRMAVRLGRECR